MLRQCSHCGLEAHNEEQLANFVKQARGLHGYRNLCKTCKKKEISKKDSDYYYDRSLRSKYNITIEDYNRMFEEQEGCCAICGKHQTETKKRLYVDHCHTTGQVRQLLCQHCNLIIGFANDNNDLLVQAIAYINKHKE